VESESELNHNQARNVKKETSSTKRLPNFDMHAQVEDGKECSRGNV
jgi:hypothetical protein